MAMQDTANVLKEITTIFASPEDIVAVEKIALLKTDINACIDAQNTTAAEAIKGLTQEVTIAQEQCAAIEGEPDRLRSERVIVEQTIDNTTNSITKLEAQYASLHTQLTDVKADEIKTNQARKENEEEAVSDMPRIKHALGLYANISRIRWDYEADNVVGYVSSPAGKADIRPFALDAQKYDSFRITNYLWDLMA
eukprot:TRINITY_DN13475_c0_g1_i1.p1 TRINITY_DN13475_c0_g1~~TRINITY_DN13475_c0_g1_i1.p1  ORF type:complete len:208 (+),score=74.63 TRINITY_DN13475_c0_g1_i1:41-625(+)